MPIASSEIELIEDNVVALPPTRILSDDPQRAMRTDVYTTPPREQETNILSLPPPVPTPHETPVTATLTPVLSAAFLYIDQGPGAGRAIPLLEGELIIGRSSTAGLQLNHPSVSRQHVTVRRAGDQFFVRDCGSHNGSYLNGRPVLGEVELFSGDELALGRVVLVLRSTAPMVTGRTVIPTPLERTGVRVAIFAGAALLGVGLVLLFARARPVEPAVEVPVQVATAPVVQEAAPRPVPAAIVVQPPAPVVVQPPAPVAEARKPVEDSVPARVAAGDLSLLADGEISATRLLAESRKSAPPARKQKVTRTTARTSKKAGFDRAAIAVYLTGDLDGAIAAATRAGDDALRSKLKQLEAAIASARADANFGDVDGARRHYARAISLDKQLGGGKGKLARELRRQLEGSTSRAPRNDSARSAADAAFGE